MEQLVKCELLHNIRSIINIHATLDELSLQLFRKDPFGHFLGHEDENGAHPNQITPH